MKSAGSYRFQYRHGQSVPYATPQATDDNDFFKKVLPAWEREKHFQHIKGTVTCTVFEHRKVPEPAISQPRPEYLLHAKKMADPSKPFVY